MREYKHISSGESAVILTFACGVAVIIIIKVDGLRCLQAGEEIQMQQMQRALLFCKLLSGA